MPRKPLLLFNQKETIGGVVRLVPPCQIEIKGLREGDAVVVDAMDSARDILESTTTLDGDSDFVFEKGELFQARRTKSVGSRVNVFASTK